MQPQHTYHLQLTEVPMLMGETRLYLHLSIFIGWRYQFNHDDNSHKHYGDG